MEVLNALLFKAVKNPEDECPERFCKHALWPSLFTPFVLKIYSLLDFPKTQVSNFGRWLLGCLPDGQYGSDWDVFHALHQHAQNCLQIHFFALKINLTPSIAERPQIQNYTTSWQKYFQKHTIQSCKISQIYVTFLGKSIRGSFARLSCLFG